MGQHLLPDVTLPALTMTTRGESLRLRQPRPGEVRLDAPSEYDNWGPFDIEFDDDAHGRALIEVATDAAQQWAQVGNMSWHSVLHGPNLGSRAISIGLALVPEARGRGIGTYAQSLLADVLHAAGVHRVEASTDVTNIAEQRSLERAGFQREGVVRGSQVRADGRHDLVLYSCLPGESATLRG